MATPRILTFNFHEPYLCLMSKIGLPMDAGHYAQGHLKRQWHAVFRPIPENITAITEDVWRERVESNYYDVIIAQNEMNALDVAKAPCGRLLLCHNRRKFLNTTLRIEGASDPLEVFNKMLQYLEHKFQFLFISESKRDDYGIPGRVILPGIDLDEYSGYRGEERCAIRVGNTMRQRTLMFDHDFQEQVCAGLPSKVIGVNTDIPGSEVAASWDALREVYRRHRCMLHVTREAYEDGYNLAMLEAMATGMPVVSLANATSPLTDGVDGFVSADAGVLHDRIQQLLDDPALARELGARGRETVAAKFPLDAFCEKWREAIMLAADRSTRPAWHVLRRAKPQRVAPEGAPRMLLHYSPSPLTTGRYFDDAARAHFEVTTTGFRIPEEVLAYWGFEGPPPPYAGADVPTELRAPYADILRALPDGYTPDIFLWIDSGPEQIEPDLHLVPAPKAAYLIDTHVTPRLRLEMARKFDLVFMAQKAQVNLFRAEGIANAHWLPLACSPDLHAVGACDRHFDFAYVGSLSNEEGDRRRRLFGDLSARFPNCFVGRAWPEDMARIYAQSKIVVNACFRRDVNMRVFEAMAAGALLITDEAEGLGDLFTDGEHLVVYHDDAGLPALVERYLNDHEARERIARAGQALVLREHTYEKRMETIAKTCREVFGPVRRAQDPTEKDNKAYYQCPREEIIPFVPIHTRRLLDVGCGMGLLASTLKRERNLAEASGIEIIETAWQEARKRLDTCLLGSIEEMELPFPDEHFDCIICADVLEHLANPAAALRKLSRVLAPDGSIVISIPNIRFYEIVAMLAAGGWAYMEAGIMDSTHLRFFCGPDLHTMVEEAGLRIARLQPLSMLSPEKLQYNEDGSIDVGIVKYLHPTPGDYEGLRVYQYCVIACKPDVDRLGRARAALDAGHFDDAAALANNATGADLYEQKSLVAKALAKGGRLDDAIGIYVELLAEKDDPATRADFGTVLLAAGRTAEARPLLARSLEDLAEPDRVEAALGLLDLMEGNLDSAFAHLFNALSASTGHVEMWAHLLPLAEELGRSAELLPALREHADFYPSRSDLILPLCALLIEAGSVPEARERLETFLLFDPGNAEAEALLAKMA